QSARCGSLISLRPNVGKHGHQPRPTPLPWTRSCLRETCRVCWRKVPAGHSFESCSNRPVGPLPPPPFHQPVGNVLQVFDHTMRTSQGCSMPVISPAEDVAPSKTENAACRIRSCLRRLDGQTLGDAKRHLQNYDALSASRSLIRQARGIALHLSSLPQAIELGRQGNARFQCTFPLSRAISAVVLPSESHLKDAVWSGQRPYVALVCIFISFWNHVCEGTEDKLHLPFETI
ncbi:hypothetical protein EV129_12760, partial [Rhizobium azibense]